MELVEEENRTYPSKVDNIELDFFRFLWRLNRSIFDTSLPYDSGSTGVLDTPRSPGTEVCRGLSP